jgi:hypothetical protein
MICSWITSSNTLATRIVTSRRGEDRARKIMFGAQIGYEGTMMGSKKAMAGIQCLHTDRFALALLPSQMQPDGTKTGTWPSAEKVVSIQRWTRSLKVCSDAWLRGHRWRDAEHLCASKIRVALLDIASFKKPLGKSRRNCQTDLPTR